MLVEVRDDREDAVPLIDQPSSREAALVMA
jgi:hypothetical protein